MSNADIAEVNLLKKRQSKAENRAKILRRNREIKKQRERILAQWISESKIDMDGELADIYAMMLINDRIKG